MTQTLRLGIFSANVVANWAEEHGVFAAHGLAVQQIPVASSPAQFASLMDGEYDAVLTSPDNVATYVLNERNPLGRRLDLQILRAVDRGGRLSLVGAPGIERLDRPGRAPVRRRRPDLRFRLRRVRAAPPGRARGRAATTRW